MLDNEVCSNVSKWPEVGEFSLPVNHVEIHCVEVGDHQSGVQDVVKEDKDWNYHVGDVYVSSCQEEYYEVAVVSNWKELVNGGQDEDVTVQIFAVFMVGAALHIEKDSWDCAWNNQDNAKYELRKPHKPKNVNNISRKYATVP